MKKYFISIIALSLSIGAFAQNGNTMFIHQNGAVHEFSTQSLDSIVFYRTPEGIFPPISIVNRVETGVRVDTVTKVVTDTVINTVTVKDTVEITVKDTIEITVKDTVKITVKDTVEITVKDTVEITIKDTVEITVEITIKDTIKLINPPKIVGSHADLGEISFATSDTWKVGEQTWSDAVQTSVCSEKTKFTGSSSGYDLADCRSNPNYNGDLFSWVMVDLYKDVLCPSPWRIPTKDDFVNLDKALGGNGVGGSSTSLMLNKYILWGGAYGGSCNSNGSLVYQGTRAFYWSQSTSESISNRGYNLNIVSNVDSIFIYPQGEDYKNYGYALRCVR